MRTPRSSCQIAEALKSLAVSHTWRDPARSLPYFRGFLKRYPKDARCDAMRKFMAESEAILSGEIQDPMQIFDSLETEN